jgi:hypothetical protein
MTAQSFRNPAFARNCRTNQVLLGAALAVVMFPPLARASDVWVVRFQTDIVYSSPTECYRVGWRDHLLFRNTTNQDLAVSALGASNGYTVPGPEPLVIPARGGRSVLIQPRLSEGGSTNRWAPKPETTFIVNRLDVPQGIIAESRGELWGPLATPLPCPPPEPGGVPASEVFGSIPLPVVRSLAPAGTEQIHLASDLGTQPIRTNVGIYNAGTAMANAAIELRRLCDDAVVERRFTAVPANAVVQVFGITDTPRTSGNSCSSSGSTYFSRYVVVVMDQPGFSFVTTLANELPPRIAISTSVAR